MSSRPVPKRALVATAISMVLLTSSFSVGFAQQQIQQELTPTEQVTVDMQAFALVKGKCTVCHNSVADPEKPGKTRDEWYRIVNLMRGHGAALTAEEGDLVVDYLYRIRRGIERDPG